MARLCPIVCLLLLGCSLGPRSLETNRLRYNEAIKTTTEKQLLLNIVRLRYIDSPSSLSIANIAEQQEIVGGLKAIPFFTAAGTGVLGTYQGLVLPQAELGAANRPTLSYSPIDDQDFARRLLTPITLEGVAYLSKTTWPTSTVFRLYLENLNWVSNAESASGPTPRDPPEFAAFREGIDAIQRLQDRKLMAFWVDERGDKQGGPVPGDIPAAAAVDAVKAGFELQRADKGFDIVKKKMQPIVRVSDAAAGDPDFQTMCRVFKLDPSKRTFDLTTDKLDPFFKDVPPAGADVMDLETRSLLQVLFFISQGIEVPAAHACIAPMTRNADGTPFDWDLVLSGLFKVRCAAGHRAPPCASVAVRYRDHWFYIDDRDRDTKATFALLIELTRLELTARAGSGSAPILTLPIGGR